jgi:hypothetical protein
MKMLDSRWFERMQLLIRRTGETYELLLPPLEQYEAEYRAFVDSRLKQLPNLYPRDVDVVRLTGVRQELCELAAEVEADEKHNSVRRLYAERITEVITNIELVVAAQAHNDTKFEELNLKLYGPPDKTVFAAEVAWLRDFADDFLDETPTARPAEREAARTVLELLPKTPKGEKADLVPEADVFHMVRELHFLSGGYMDTLFGERRLEPGAVITPQGGDSIVRRAIAAIGSDFALEVSPDGLWSVSHQRHTVYRPAEYALEPPAFYGIVAHEVGSHLWESVNGGRSKLRLLSLGLAGYEKGNEGRAQLREQIMLPTPEAYVSQIWHPAKASWQYRIAIHTVICLASGMGGETFGFRDIYRLLVALFNLWAAKNGNDMIKPGDEDLARGAYHMAVRALKGTSGRGGAYYKDIVYLEGNIRAWQLANEWPELILYGDLGKFNIGNREHVTMLQELGIIPKQ